MNELIFSVIGVIIGYLIKFGLDKRQQFITKNAEIKRAAYSELVDLMLDLFSQDKIGQISTKQLLKRLNSFYSKYILYASQEVILSYAEFMQYMYNNSDNLDTVRSMKLMTKVFKHMRKDIGLKSYQLGADGEKLLRARFTDFDQLFGVKDG